MTLVIACKTVDGILMASDGRGITRIPDSQIIHKSEDTKKIFELGPTCAALVYGDGAADYDEVFNAFLDEVVVYPGYDGKVDYELCVKSLPSFLNRQYKSRLVSTTKVVGVMVVGINRQGKYKICDMVSARREFYPYEAVNGVHYGGMTRIARDFFKTRSQVTQRNSKEIYLDIKNLIELTADSYSESVNKNITLKLLSENGIVDYTVQ